MMLLRDKEKQEFVSREKKDRLNFEQISALATRMGLYRYLIFCFIRIDDLTSRHIVNHHKVKLMNQNYIWQPSLCKSCCL